MADLRWGTTLLRWGSEILRWGASPVSVTITTPPQAVAGDAVLSLSATSTGPVTRTEWTGSGLFHSPRTLNTDWTAPPAQVASVVYMLRVEVFDAQGNTGAASVAITVTGSASAIPPSAVTERSVWDIRAVDGWRDPELPIATPGLVAAGYTPPLSGGTITFIDNSNRILWHRIPPLYIKGDEDAFLRAFSLTNTRLNLRLGRSSVDTESQKDYELSTHAQQNLAFLIRAGDGQIFKAKVADLWSKDSSAPYAWPVDAADVRQGISDSEHCGTFWAIVDLSANNVDYDNADFSDPLPRYVPLTPVTLPVSVFDEAVTPGFGDNPLATPGVEYRHTRRGPYGSAVIVDVGDEGLDVARLAVPGVSPPTYFTQLAVAEDAVSFQLSHQWWRQVGSPTLPVVGRVCVLRASDGTTITWDAAERLNSDQNGWDLPDTIDEDTVDKFKAGTADFAILQGGHPNINVENLTAARTAQGAVIQLFAVTTETVETVMNLTVARPDGVMSIGALTQESLELVANLTVTPFTGQRPETGKLSVEVKEPATAGRFRGRRLFDRTGEFSDISWNLQLGQVGTFDAELPMRDEPTVSYTPQAPEYLDRAVDARLLDPSTVGAIFRAASPVRILSVGDRVVLSDITTAPVADLADVSFRVRGLAPRGGQAYSLFDYERANRRFSGLLASGGVVEFRGCLIVDSVIMDKLTILPPKDEDSQPTLALTYLDTGDDLDTAPLRDNNTLMLRHDASGDRWAVPMEDAVVDEDELTITVPVPEDLVRGLSGEDLTSRLEPGEPYTVVIAANGDPRVDYADGTTSLVEGDSIFDRALPAAETDPHFAGLLDRTTSRSTTTLSDASQRLQLLSAGDARYVSSAARTGSSLVVSVQDRDGSPATLSARQRARYAFGVYHPESGATHEFTFASGTLDATAGTYTWTTTALGALTPEAVTVAVYDKDHFAIRGGHQLLSRLGGFVEVSLEAPLPARQTTGRFRITLGSVFPQVGYAEAVNQTRWAPRDGTEFRTVLYRWPLVEAPLSIPVAGTVRIDTTGLTLPPLNASDSVFFASGVVLLNGDDPLDTPLPIITIRQHSIDVMADAALTGAVGKFQRASDRVRNFGGFLIEPRSTSVAPTQREVSVSGVDYSIITDRRFNSGQRIISREGERPGQFVSRLFDKWRMQDEEFGKDIDETLGEPLEPAFDDDRAGGATASWRTILDAVQARARGSAVWQATASRVIQWREPAGWTGLLLTEDNMMPPVITEDRQRARNVVFVRPDVDRSIMLEDTEDIEARRAIEGGTGRAEAISDSREGNSPGEEIAIQHGEDSLIRYPYLFNAEFRSAEHTAHLDPLQQIAMLRLQPGDLVMARGRYSPQLPPVTITRLGQDTLYVEPTSANDAIPDTVEPGKFLQLERGGRLFEVEGGGGPRGSFWVREPEGVQITIPVNPPAVIFEAWLATGIRVTASAQTGEIRFWSISGIRPRIGRTAARAQDGVLGLYRAAFAGIAN